MVMCVSVGGYDGGVVGSAAAAVSAECNWLEWPMEAHWPSLVQTQSHCLDRHQRPKYFSESI